MRFSTLGLCDPLLHALHDMDYVRPTAIQSQAIPPIIAGRDVIAAAQTGSGKTAGFILPIHQLLHQRKLSVIANRARALILVPTRELAMQVHECSMLYGKYMKFKSAVVFGGVKINPQMMSLRAGVDILVATPGRLIDLMEKNAIILNSVEILVLDEADRMLDMGFINEIRALLNHLPSNRQNLCFSATYSDEIRKLIGGVIKNPVEINIGPRNSPTKQISHVLHPVDKRNKTKLLTYLVNEMTWDQVLVFTATKRSADILCSHLEKCNLSVASIHSDKNQSTRNRVLMNFKNGIIKVLIATDVAARGIDVFNLACVINFDLPVVAEYYIHRVGRSGRAGKKGHAISLVCADEVAALSAIESLVGKLIPREFIAGFEPRHNVPLTQLKALKPKKPKKPKKVRDSLTGVVTKKISIEKKSTSRSKSNSNSWHGKSKQKQKTSRTNEKQSKSG